MKINKVPIFQSILLLWGFFILNSLTFSVQARNIDTVQFHNSFFGNNTYIFDSKMNMN